ncbi:MAG: FAD-binding protein [Chloroflexi bacterium]|nr:FAD-binding protein [Chloroflexota bacterium]
MDRRRLLRELQAAVGKRFVIHRPEDLLVFEVDGSVDRALPTLVVLPGSTQEVARVVRIARRYGVPVVPRGAGTGLSGGAVAVQGGILLSMNRLRRILAIDPENLLAVVEAGVVNIEVSYAAAKHGLCYAPDPSSQKACTIGGNVAENAGGPHCLAYGVTANHVLGLEVVLADGSIVWFGGRTRESIGYDLRGILVGSEGTLAVVTKAVLRLLPLPEAVNTLLAIFPEIDQAGNAVTAIIGRGIVPAALEMLDHLTIQAVEPAVHAGYPQDAGAVLLVEVAGLREAVAEEAEEVEAILRQCGATEVRSAEEPEARERLWAGRKGALGALGRLAPNYYLLDGVVPRTRILEALQRIRMVSQKHGLPIANVFHAGDGNLHPCVLFDERKPGELARAKEAGAETLRICVELGGTLSGEHGIGIEKQEYMSWVFSPADLAAMAALRPAFGAEGFLNPGKVFPTGASCGEVPQQAAMSRLGRDAYVESG